MHIEVHCRLLMNVARVKLNFELSVNYSINFCVADKFGVGGWAYFPISFNFLRTSLNSPSDFLGGNGLLGCCEGIILLGMAL